MAIRHDDLWRAIDTLAAENGLTPSGLARAAGLDATTFNRSKRRNADGRLRWPSTESLSRALAATGATLEGFTVLIRGARTMGQTRRERTLQTVRLEAADARALFDETGAPAGAGWEREATPALATDGDYALRVHTDAHEPVLSRGDLAMVSPDAAIEAGDRVLACHGDEVFAGRLVQLDGARLTFAPAERRALRTLPRAALAWMHRITWIGR